MADRETKQTIAERSHRFSLSNTPGKHPLLPIQARIARGVQTDAIAPPPPPPHRAGESRSEARGNISFEGPIGPDNTSGGGGGGGGPP